MIDVILLLLSNWDFFLLLFLLIALAPAGMAGFSIDRLGYHSLASYVSIVIFFAVFFGLLGFKYSWSAGRRHARQSKGPAGDPDHG
jgi:hypothetical protein